MVLEVVLPCIAVQYDLKNTEHTGTIVRHCVCSPALLTGCDTGQLVALPEGQNDLELQTF